MISTGTEAMLLPIALLAVTVNDLPVHVVGQLMLIGEALPVALIPAGIELMM
jgi:hypothetical protein